MTAKVNPVFLDVIQAAIKQVSDCNYSTDYAVFRHKIDLSNVDLDKSVNENGRYTIANDLLSLCEDEKGSDCVVYFSSIK